MHLLPENIVNLAAVTLDSINLALSGANGIGIDVLRLDKIDPVISGNKWFKLKHHLESALLQKQTRLLTFGGAWSNHIVATACAAKKAGLKSIGIIRGEQPAILSSTLVTAVELGMQLMYTSREKYQQKNDPAFILQLQQDYNDPYIIPEGGEGKKGIQGAAEITGLVNVTGYTHILCAIGTGTMLSGLLVGTPQQQIIGIPVLKGFDHWLPANISEQSAKRLHILPGYHMGGYAKKTTALLDFMNAFYRQTGIPTDFVYTGKLFFSLVDLLKKDYFPSGSRLLVIHSGGLQGNDSLPEGTLIF